MKKCRRCDKSILFGGYEDENGQFCSRNCARIFKAETTGFCAKCLEETVDESPGSVTSVNGIGTMLRGSIWRARGIDPCPDCGSVIQTKWKCVVIPVNPLGTYRILYFKKGLRERTYMGRRLKNDPVNQKSS